MVYHCSRAVNIPVIGLGGIVTADDAVEYLLAGASAVQVGTASFRDPRAPLRVIDGIEKFLKRRALTSIRDVVGQMKT
jgi:dihydroorotate dehydrogenase (NAD+) catalytic subunit